MDTAEYFGISGENEMVLVMQDELLEEKGLLENGTAYLSYEAVKTWLNNRFYWDSSENLMLYTTPEDVIQAAAGEASYTVSGEKKETDYAIVKVEGDQAYIAADFVKQYTAMDYEIYENPNRAVITCRYGEITKADLKRKTVVRTLGGIKSPVGAVAMFAAAEKSRS